MQLEMEGVKQPVTTSDIDNIAQQYYEARKNYEAKKEESSLAFAKYEELELKLIAMLESVNKDDYSVKGLGKFKISHKLSVRVPDSPESKDAFFKWVEDKYGKEGLNKYRTVNSNSLNSLYKAVLDECVSKGEEFKGIEGIGEPTSRSSLTFKGEK